MEDKDQTEMIEYYQNIFELQDKDFRNSNLRKMVKKKLTEGTLLDIGCGTGHMSLLAAKKGHKVMAIDALPEMVEYANRLFKRNKLQVTAEVLDAENLNELKEYKFDNIVMLDVLEHIENDIVVLRNINDLLTANGRLLLVVPTIKSFFGERDKIMHHKRRYNKNELLDKLGNTGFKVVEVRFWNISGVIPYWLFERILKRKVPEKIRYQKRGTLSLFLSSVLGLWFKIIENNIRFPIGLSLFIVAQRKLNETG